VRLALLAEAEAELEDAATWYDDRRRPNGYFSVGVPKMSSHRSRRGTASGSIRCEVRRRVTNCQHTGLASPDARQLGRYPFGLRKQVAARPSSIWPASVKAT